jgi:hypothetical protein
MIRLTGLRFLRYAHGTCAYQPSAVNADSSQFGEGESGMTTDFSRFCRSSDWFIHFARPHGAHCHY